MSEDLELLLQHLADESRSVRSLNLAPLSDLSRGQAAGVHAALAHFSPRRRLEIISTMVEQAEANVHFHFVALLRECLTDTEAAVRRAAIDGLWEDERPSLVEPLARILSEDPSEEARAAAAVSLGRFVLLGVLGEISDAHAHTAEQAMHAAWRRPGEVVEVRRRALEGLAYTDEAGVDELIEIAYYDEDELMRQSAVFAMGRSADRRWSKLILTELSGRDAAMRYEAAIAAGELGLTAAVRSLIRLLDDADSTVREAAATALGKIGGRDARQALQACRESGDSVLVAAATEALEELAFNSESLDTPFLDYSRQGDFDPLAEDEELVDGYDLDLEDDGFEVGEDDEDDDDEDDWREDDEFGEDDEFEEEDDEFEEDLEEEDAWRPRR
jgi:hypothetical protein